MAYWVADKSVYPVIPENFKKYIRDLELYRRKANVLADGFRHWFVKLWHGKCSFPGWA